MPAKPTATRLYHRSLVFCIWLSLAATGSLFSQHTEEEHDHEPEHLHSDAEEHSAEASHHEEDHTELDEHGHEEEGRISITPEVMKEFGIEIAKVGSGVLQETITLPGEIQFNGERVAHVTPRFHGTIQSISARLADSVTTGKILASMENAETLRPFEVKAPFDGTIVTYDITLGETIEAGTPLFTIADLSSVWADLQIYQKDMPFMSHGLKVKISGPHGSTQYTGTIAYIAPTIDEHTRTGLARVIVDNSEKKWKPGQFVTGEITVEEHPIMLMIPRSAILELDGNTIVFVQEGAEFEPRTIKLGHSDDHHYEVISGLEQGETIVTRNALSLKAELGKASFGGHEGHVH